MLTSFGASAAELNVSMLTSKPAFEWNGFYAGGNIGGSWSGDEGFGKDQLTWQNSFARLNTTSTGGFVGGAQLGWNYQIGKIVAGAEADFSLGGATSKSDSYTVISNSAFANSASAEIEWFGTLRARIGIAPTDRFLIFATAGLAYAQIAINASDIWSISGLVIGIPNSGNAQYPTSSGIQFGWTAGAGIEYALNDAVSIKAEALYLSFGTAEYTLMNPYSTLLSFDGNVSMGIARAGASYHF